MASYGSFGGGFSDGLLGGMKAVSMFKDLRDQKEKSDATEMLFKQGNIEGEQMRQQDLTNYNNQKASLFGGGYTPTSEETAALDQGFATLQTQKPSEMFRQQITGMNSQERLGHMVTLAQQGGLKINNNTLEALTGVNTIFDKVQKDDLDHEAKLFTMAEAQRAQQQAIDTEKQKQADRFATGELVYQTFKDDEKYKGLFGSIAGAGEGADMSRFAGVAPLLFKDSQSSDKLLNAFLISKMGNDTKKDIAEQSNDTKELIASQGNDTKQIVAALGGSNDFYKQESLRLREDEAKYKREKDKEEAKTKDLENRRKTYQDRKKQGADQLKDDKDFKKLNGAQQDEVLSYYATHGVMPKREVKKQGLFTDGLTTFKTNTPPQGKSNPTKTAPRGDIIKQIKASYPNATQGQINAFLKQKGY